MAWSHKWETKGTPASGARQFKQLQRAGAIDDIVKIEAYKDPSLWFMDAAQRINEFPKQNRSEVHLIMTSGVAPLK